MYTKRQCVCPTCGEQMVMAVALGTFIWTCPKHGSPYIQTTTASTKTGV